MRFAQAYAVGTQAKQPKPIIEYPKYVHVDGKAVLALNAEHEAELLGPIIEDDAGDENSSPLSDNLLSAPQKRGPGRPRLVRPDPA